jgi:hypothetical protein
MNIKTASASTLSLAGASIVISARAPATARVAAGELARRLFQLTGRISPVVGRLPDKGPAVVLDAAAAAALGVGVEAREVGDQGYRLASFRRGRSSGVAVSAASAVGTLYGVYGLLEELGMGFYAGGETFPDLPAPAVLPQAFDRIARPAFKVRGNMLHYNFLCGCTTWGLDDYKFYFDQLSRMRCNMLLMHWYDGEPGAAYQLKGEYLAGGPTPSTLSKPWGALAALRTSEFSFGTGRFFDEELFTSPPGERLSDRLTEIKRSEAMFSEATRYAREAGVGVAAGFETPRTDPDVPRERERFRARLLQFLERNPHLSRFALWEHESGGCVGMEPPAAGTPGAALLEKRRSDFAYLGNTQRVWEAIRYGRFAELAAEVLAKEAPHIPLVLVGWGGDRWMQFADYCLAYDKMLPENVAFTCHDNIDASMGPNVSTPWGQLPPARERWAMPWVEGDIEDCMVRQPHVESLGKLAPDALAKGCQGLLTLQWRTRDVEEETGYIARFAWNPQLTPETFYRDLASHAFGPDQEKRMGRNLGALQKLGARWTGVRGTAECSAMRWTGWEPHFPFEIDERAASYLIPKVEAIVKALSEVPTRAESEAAFHLIPQGQSAPATQDQGRPGVQVAQAVLKRLQELAGENSRPVLVKAFREIEEMMYALRPSLVAFGMTSRSYQAIDGFLIALHHVWRNAGVVEHGKVLRTIRREVEGLRRRYVKDGRLARLERLDYLASTMDYVMHFDRAVMLLADGEQVEQALARAAGFRDAGDPMGAAAIAAGAYRDLVAAGMKDAVAAFTRKLTTRCDFGTLATINVKPLPRYWEAVGRLEAFLPAVPPRDVQARGREQEVWLSWHPGKPCAAQHLYRRLAAGSWKRIDREPLAGDCSMFIDRPPRPGAYEYAVVAVDAKGWESPMSHPASAVFGPMGNGPRIVACKPYGRLTAGVDFHLRAAVVSDRDVARVDLVIRPSGAGKWERVPMMRRFRESYEGVVPAGALGTGWLEFYVEASDADGRRTVWPETAPALPWSASVQPSK